MQRRDFDFEAGLMNAVRVCMRSPFTIQNAGELSEKEKQWKINSVQIELCTYKQSVYVRMSVSARAFHVITRQQKKSQCSSNGSESKARISFGYLHGTIRSMNDKYWNMLYDHRTNNNYRTPTLLFYSLSRTSNTVCAKSKQFLFFLIALWHIQWCEFWRSRCCCCVRVLMLFSASLADRLIVLLPKSCESSAMRCT